jgi:carboxyl-terminal processing protease
MKKILYLVVLISVGLSSACKKSKKPDEPTPVGPTKTGSTLDLIKDSIYLYTKEDYYWNTSIPEYTAFNPRAVSGSSDDEAVAKEVDMLSQYAINPATGQAYEYNSNSPGEAKYSFIDNGQTSTSLGGTNGDFGFALTYYTSATDLRVRYVYPGSPAGNAAMHRGDLVVKMNNRTSLSASITNDYNAVVAGLSGNALTMTLQRPNGTQYDVSINRGSYTVNPVLLYKVIDQGTKKVGYVVFNSFTSPANAQPKLLEAFNYFATNGITDLVVDLRYNGGGYVSTAEYLTNLIVPAGKTNTTMYNTFYNSILTSGKAQLLRNQVRKDNNGNAYNYAQIDFSLAGNKVNFSKVGNLNVNRVFFIVTGSTASASELTINNLRPHMNVQLIGRTTYGKPVGFFDIKINKYELYVPEFETKNSADQGGYYTGMAPGSSAYPGYLAGDDLSKDFGDPAEGLLARALAYVNTGNYAVASLKTQKVNVPNAITADESEALTQKFDEHKFKGMVYDKAPKMK